ncbi:MAG TPA: class I adenylate-forming enzyme family protein [Thermoanaerobaculia bacterium]|nr:class I adenylate-forming enzyme family protein [Thermoanaerobaculia bacterium]
MFDNFLALTADAPDAVALIDGGSGHITTRAQLLARGREIAAELTRAGIAEGDLVAVQLPNSIEFIAAWLAALERRFVFVPIDRDAPETEIASLLGHFGIRGLLYRPDRSLPGYAITTRPATSRPPLPTAARLLKLTSGSTGKPKAIVASEANLLADCRNICSTMQIAPSDTNLGAIPFSHSYGFSNLVSPLVVQGTAVVISNDYLPQSIIDLANHYRCTVAPLIPMVFDHLASVPGGNFASVRTFISAGAPLPASTSRRFRERFGVDIHSFYGCSECGGITYDPEGGAVERGSVGPAMNGVELDVKSARVTVRSESVALGYLIDEKTFQPLESRRFLTDDLVEVRENGDVVLTGRASDLINTAGKKVNPREVEQVIMQIEGVRQVKVYGEPAGARGEVVAAAVVGDPDLTREEIREYCRTRLSLHKVPRIVKLIESIPVDERGKVKRAALAQL